MSAKKKIKEKYDFKKPSKDEDLKVPDKPNRDVTLEIEYLPLESLNAAVYNPRTITQEQLNKLVKGINEYGFIDPVIINTYPGRDNVIVGGHQRCRAAKILGMPSVPCVKINVDEKAEKALNIALNRISGEFVLDQLTDLLRELHESSLDLDLTGFTQMEINALLGFEENTDRPDPDEIPEPPYIVAEEGDYWICGNHRLLVGDSTKKEDLQRLMAGQLADMIWTDPPYNVAYESKAGKIQNDDMSSGEFDDFLMAAFSAAFDVTKAGGCAYVAHAEGENTGVTFRQTFQRSGFLLKQVLIWVKNQATLCRADYNWRHEPVLYGWKPGAAHWFNQDFTQNTVVDDEQDIDKMDKRQLLGLVKELRNRIPESVIRVDKPLKSEWHPTTKPVALVERMMIASSQEGELVLDSFGGSGTTMITAEKTGRRARLMELDPKYATVILERIWGYSRTEPQLEKADGSLISYTEVKKLRGK